MAMMWGYCEDCRKKHGWPPKVTGRLTEVWVDPANVVLIDNCPRPQFNGLWLSNGRAFADGCLLCSTPGACYMTYTSWPPSMAIPGNRSERRTLMGKQLWDAFYCEHGEKMNHRYCESCRQKLHLPKTHERGRRQCQTCGEHLECYRMPDSRLSRETSQLLKIATEEVSCRKSPPNQWERLLTMGD